jgi:hypothetical protein
MLAQEDLLLGNERRECIELEETHFVDLGARSWRAATRAASEPDIETLWPHAGPQLENLNDLDDETALFAYLALDRFHRRFIWFHEPARESPRRERSVRVTKEENAASLVEHHSKNADEEGRAGDSCEQSLDR